MDETRRSVSCDLSKSGRDIWLSRDLIFRKHNLREDSRFTSEDSGFIEQMGVGKESIRSRTYSTYNDSETKAKNLDKQTTHAVEQTICSEEQTTHNGDIEVDSGQLSHGLPKCSKDLQLLPGSPIIPEKSGLETSISEDSIRSVDSYIEFTAVDGRHIDSEMFVREETEPLSCGPQTPPDFPMRLEPSQAVVMLTSPHSIQGKFLRVIEDMDNPKLILDKFRLTHQHQYYLMSETMIVMDEHNNTHHLMCFRYDLFGKSFYLVPHGPADTCPVKLVFKFVEASRDDVIDEFSHENSKFWYRFKSKDLNVLESLGHPMYFLSIEEGPDVVLRRTEEEYPETRNFGIEIINAKKLSMFRKFINHFSCFK